MHALTPFEAFLLGCCAMALMGMAAGLIGALICRYYLRNG